MPRVPGMKALPWMRVVWLFQIVFGAFQELEQHERKLAREIATRTYRERRLHPNDRKHLVRMARKAGKGAARGARRGGISGVRGKRG